MLKDRLNHARIFNACPEPDEGLAITFTAPPQYSHVPISILNTRFKRCAQVIATWRAGIVALQSGDLKARIGVSAETASITLHGDGVAFSSAQDARWITGSEIVVDGRFLRIKRTPESTIFRRSTRGN